MAQTCLESTQLAAVIFGAIFGTLALCTGFAFVIWYLVKHHQLVVEKFPILEKGRRRTNASTTKPTCLDQPDCIENGSKNHLEKPVNGGIALAALGLPNEKKDFTQHNGNSNGCPQNQETVIVTYEMSPSENELGRAEEQQKSPPSQTKLEHRHAEAKKIVCENANQNENGSSKDTNHQTSPESEPKNSKDKISDVPKCPSTSPPSTSDDENDTTEACRNSQIPAEKCEDTEEEIQEVIEIIDETEPTHQMEKIAPKADPITTNKSNGNYQHQNGGSLEVVDEQADSADIKSNEQNSHINKQNGHVNDVKSAKNGQNGSLTNGHVGEAKSARQKKNIINLAERLVTDEAIEIKNANYTSTNGYHNGTAKTNGRIESSKLDEIDCEDKDRICEKNFDFSTSTDEKAAAVLSAQQFGTLETNRRRLERERQQLREMGII